MNKIYKFQLPRNKEARHIETSVKDGMIEVEVELKDEWKPKDGEICYAESKHGYRSIFVYNRENGCINKTAFHIAYNPSVDGGITTEEGFAIGNYSLQTLRPATEHEKWILFNALAKEGKKWDAERKQLVDLPRWRAERGGLYHYVNSGGKVVDDYDERMTCDNMRYEVGNYFKTMEAAEKMAEPIRDILRKSKTE